MTEDGRKESRVEKLSAALALLKAARPPGGKPLPIRELSSKLACTERNTLRVLRLLEEDGEIVCRTGIRGCEGWFAL